jgi:predicted site-specific integrase-resolvase
MAVVKDWLEVSDVAELFGRKPETVRRWLRAGRLRGVLLFGRWRVEGQTMRDLREKGSLVLPRKEAKPTTD